MRLLRSIGQSSRRRHRLKLGSNEQSTVVVVHVRWVTQHALGVNREVSASDGHALWGWKLCRHWGVHEIHSHR